MKNLPFLLLIFITSCNTIAQTKNTKIVITGVRYIYHYHKEDSLIAKYKTNLEAYPIKKFRFASINSSLDSFVFDDSKKYSLVRYGTTKFPDNSFRKRIYYFQTTQLQKRDSIKYMPPKILDFELKGMYIDSVNGDGESPNLFYINPKTKDILQIDNDFYIGNTSTVFIYTHNDSENPLKGNMEILKDLLQVNKPHNTHNYINIKIDPSKKNGSNMSIEESDKPFKKP